LVVFFDCGTKGSLTLPSPGLFFSESRTLRRPPPLPPVIADNNAPRSSPAPDLGCSLAMRRDEGGGGGGMFPEGGGGGPPEVTFLSVLGCVVLGWLVCWPPVFC